MTEPNLCPAQFTDYHEQTQCGLFSRLPAEIRYEIFANALTSAPNTALPLEQDEYCTRPGYETRHRTYTELLRTCKKIYMEAWFMPFICSEHAFWMAHSDRTPEKAITIARMQQGLDLIHDRHGEVRGGHVRVFPQLWALEGTRDLDGILGLKHFYPTSITITIRYTDTWMWETNEALHINGSWANRVVLPPSVTRFCIDIESIERRKDEVDWMADQMADQWKFKRGDHTTMVADKSDIAISRWTGSSVLGERRWVRDEVAPGQLRYYVKSVLWRPSRELGARHHNCALAFAGTRPSPRDFEWSYISQDYLKFAQIPMSLPAEQVIAKCIADEYDESRCYGTDAYYMCGHGSSDNENDSE